MPGTLEISLYPDIWKTFFIDSFNRNTLTNRKAFNFIMSFPSLFCNVSFLRPNSDLWPQKDILHNDILYVKFISEIPVGVGLCDLCICIIIFSVNATEFNTIPIEFVSIHVSTLMEVLITNLPAANYVTALITWGIAPKDWCHPKFNQAADGSFSSIISHNQLYLTPSFNVPFCPVTRKNN